MVLQHPLWNLSLAENSKDGNCVGGPRLTSRWFGGVLKQASEQDQPGGSKSIPSSGPHGIHPATDLDTLILRFGAHSLRLWLRHARVVRLGQTTPSATRMNNLGTFRRSSNGLSPSCRAHDPGQDLTQVTRPNLCAGTAFRMLKKHVCYRNDGRLRG